LTASPSPKWRQPAHQPRLPAQNHKERIDEKTDADTGDLDRIRARRFCR
jgi:hypothetical protein